MPIKLFEVKREIARLVTQAREIADSNPELRSLPAEDQAKVDAILADVNDLSELKKRLEALDVAAASAGAPDPEKPEERSQRGGERGSLATEFEARGGDRNRPVDVFATPEYRSAFLGWLGTGVMDLAPEYRNLVLGTNTQGGFMVAPTQLSSSIIMALNNMVFVRQYATIETVDSAASLGVREVATMPNDADWTPEIGTINDDTNMSFNRRDLFPKQSTKLIKASLRLLNASPESEALIRDRISYKQGVTQENMFFNGSGSGQPLGAFVASANGIPTSRDFNCTAIGSTAILADQIVSAKTQIKQQYWKSKGFAWVMSRAMVQAVRLLKDNQGRYLWTDGLAAAPDQLCGIPVNISEYAPAVFTANSYVAVLGDWSQYRIADVRAQELQRLVELFALTSEVGFISRLWVDGMPTLPEAWVRLKIAPAS